MKAKNRMHKKGNKVFIHLYDRNGLVVDHTIIDSGDWERVKMYRWRHGTRTVETFSKKTGRIRLHHLIIGSKPKRGYCVDHINGDVLDNRRSNLRVATYAQNSINSKTPISNTTGYKGVCWDKVNRKYQAQIKVKGKTLWLGRFLTKRFAAEEYNRAAKKYHGEFARLNDIPDDY